MCDMLTRECTMHSHWNYLETFMCLLAVLMSEILLGISLVKWFIFCTWSTTKILLFFILLIIQNMSWYRASYYPRDDGACLQMRLSYSPAAQFFLFLVQWSDCHFAGALGLLRILIYKVHCFLLYFILPTLSISFTFKHCSLLPNISSIVKHNNVHHATSLL